MGILFLGFFCLFFENFKKRGRQEKKALTKRERKNDSLSNYFFSRAWDVYKYQQITQRKWDLKPGVLIGRWRVFFVFFLRFIVRRHGWFIPDPSAKAFNEALGREKLADAFGPWGRMWPLRCDSGEYPTNRILEAGHTCYNYLLVVMSHISTLSSSSFFSSWAPIMGLL